MNAQTRTTTENDTLLTDLYQLTMNVAYHEHGKNDIATFDYFIRSLPKDWGFLVACGIEDILDYATSIRFTDEDVADLKMLPEFKKKDLEWLKDVRFTGDIYAVREGTPIGPNNPIMRITAPRIEAQLLESRLLNIGNYQTLVATKAHRVIHAASGRPVIDFGLRRGHERDAAMKCAYATYIAGTMGTSNVKAGLRYGIPVKGTHAHSFVMTFPTELEAFRAYVKTFPENATLLIDTYDTIQGARNAAIVARELEGEGKHLSAVRIDSGDLAQLSKEVRKILDEHGLPNVRITATNDLNEYKISELHEQGAATDGYGVGTEMITAKPVAAISGVYKLAEDSLGGKVKLSKSKKSYPGKKQVYRAIDEKGAYAFDVLGMHDEVIQIPHYTLVPLLVPQVLNGRRVEERKSVHAHRSYALDCIVRMPQHTKVLRVTQPYETSISPGLERLTNELAARYARGGA